MIEYVAQYDYLREVQTTFGSSGSFNMQTLLLQLLYVLVPMLTVIVVWRYRKIIGFIIGRSVAQLASSGKRRIVANYLVTKEVPIEICLYSNDGVGRKIGNAHVVSVAHGRMQLQLLETEPSVAHIKHARVVCFMRPFAYSGKRLNAFVTYISHISLKGIVIKELSLFTPVRYKYVIRRRHVRQRVSRDGVVRVKLWGGNKAGSFWVVRPELQTVTKPGRGSVQPRIAVENISAGGIRLYIVNPKKGIPSTREGDQLVLRISVWNQASKKYSYFNVLGTIRSRFSGRNGAIGLGIQFTSEGQKVGSGYTWNPVDAGLSSLARLLAEIQE